MFETILVPLDGSAESNVALPLARTIARAAHGSIWLLRVAPDSRLDSSHAATHEAAQSIETVAAELAQSGLEVHPVTREGDAAQQILRLSADIGAQLIVMRTRGRGGLERAVFGSVAEEVLKKTTKPLLLLRPGGRRVGSIRKLLAAVDGSPGGVVALQAAVELARETGAAISVLQVVVPIAAQPFALAYDYSGVGFYDPAWDDSALEAAQAYVAGLSERVRGMGLSARGEVRMAPDVAGAIVDIAESEATDVIVMSTHALTGPARAVLGSVADAVVRSAACPVLLVKRTRAAEAAAVVDEQPEIAASAAR